MKRILTFLLFFSLTLTGFAQEGIVKIEHKFYTSWFSTSEHIPLVVEYTLTKNMLQCSKPIHRSNKFTPDPDQSSITSLAKDYRNSGFDRGHNMNAEDNKCDNEGMKECFYYSNMTPQPHSFNAGRWEDLEKLERTDATQFGKVIVTIGSVGKSETIGPDNVVVPKFMWKVIYIISQNEYDCYIFPDTDNVTNALNKYKVQLDQIENLASVTFNNGTVELESE